MSDNDQKTPGKAAGRRTLSLRPGASGASNRGASSGGSRVVVQKKRKRVVTPSEGGPKGAQSAPKTYPGGLTREEWEARQKVLERAKSGNTSSALDRLRQAGEARKKAEADERAAKALEEEERRKAQEEAQRREEEERAKAEQAAQEKRRQEEESKRQAAEKAKPQRRKGPDAVRAAPVQVSKPNVESSPENKNRTSAKTDNKDNRAQKSRTSKPAQPAVDTPPIVAPETLAPVSQAQTHPRAKNRDRDDEEPARTAARKSEPKQRQRKFTVMDALNEDNERQRSMAAMRRQRERQQKQTKKAQEPRQKVTRDVVIPEVITVQELANRMAERAADVIRELMKLGVMATINQVIDNETAQLLAETMGHRVKLVSDADVEEGLQGEDDIEEDLKPRAPIVTVMGHVDHGKTSLLDALRQANVVAKEAGGITQHIGAYQVKTSAGESITFIDTPGHAAFTAMRARGAKVTDIVILVVAADDGVMPQTKEAIAHAKAADVPMIVAINKMDKPGADPSRVRNELLQNDVYVESMGGEILDVEISALKKQGLDKLEEAILLQAELLELQANPDRAAQGVVVEAQLDRGRGAVGTVLVQKGTLRTSDIVVAGAAWGKVRALVSDRGGRVEKAGPSIPVEILGLDSAPSAGDEFQVVENEARAREIVEYRKRKERERINTPVAKSLDQLMSQLKEGERKEVPVVIKADVQGSAEAIVVALEKMSTDEVAVRVLHSGVGGVTESDVTLANASEAPILAFNVRANAPARQQAEKNQVEVRYYNVIYDLVDDIKAVMEGMLDPTLRETFLGNAKILQVFNISKVGRVAGCEISEGMARRSAKVRLIRDSVVIHEGTLSTLRRFKDEVKEVHAGQECGMAFENYQDIQPGDVIEVYEVETIARKLESS